MKKILFAVTLSLSLFVTINLSAQTDRFKPEENMLEITSLASKINLKVGQKAYYRAVEHESKGVGVGLDVEDNVMLKQVDTHIAYHYHNDANAHGKDKTTKTYVFEAVQPGKTKITVQELFRGRIHDESTIKLVIQK